MCYNFMANYYGLMPCQNTIGFYLKIILFMWILCRIMWGLHYNVIATYTDLMTRGFILAAIWNKIFHASIRKDTLQQPDQDITVFHFPSTHKNQGLLYYENKNALWNKITVYLCCKWQCYDMRLNSSLTETLLWAEGGRAGQTMDNKITRRNKRNTELSWSKKFIWS